MNTNTQILSVVTEILDLIRHKKERVKALELGLSAINGNTQDESVFYFGKHLKVSLSEYNSSVGYMHTIKQNYNTAMVFIKRGINQEIEMRKKEIEKLEEKLSKINLVEISR